MTPATELAAAAPAVRVEGAHLAFGGTLLFDRLSLVLPAGRTSCLLGPSGVGKSSLLRLIAGLAHGAEGEVVDEDGRSLAGRVAYMAQRDLLLPWLSVLDNVLLGDRLRGRPPRRERALALLAEVGLAERAADRPAALSGGMRQRTALARTLMEDKPVVLMDEPFSALDAITRFALQELAARLLAGRTVLLVTHDPLEALRLGHEIRVLAGRPALLGAAIEPAGTPPRDPADPAERGLLDLQAELLRRLTAARDA
ncbi:putative hydroxymethylpyrimidine transport system ATP-binding protein [Tistlia consotensis]|uniref:Putative hydroxymethylpyrimidine transport system ATP-binding protein n=1 Tax=Tistlia consotensis USBA 355 TaxID=560819 RepID=A0A1Y6CTA9_9PROT|nr:ABC transporter ATP-binding protein [Tistlia consotensis]SMF77797.1 putative hydroxymethylpyrimidine transport system ATP-binding protein [Tistlia consotensis USBA 355]SNS20530.1 putative hydroxymethylpyrimidine transport system ATP-binding protein [Tistlia consotensis]